MNLSKFFFKIVIVLSYLLRLMLIFLPIIWLIVNASEGGWRYGFTFIQNNFEVALFVAFALSFLLTMYHTLSFEVIEGAPDENFLKVTQDVFVKGEMSMDMLVDKISENTKRYKTIVIEEESVTVRRKVHFVPPDIISITKEGDVFKLCSKPFSRIWFIDFGRNYKNVKEIAELIKGK